MDVEARSSREPGPHLRMLVGRVVVYDEMCVEIGRDHGVDVLQEVQELLMAMTLSALCDHLTVRDVERGEQSRRPVPDIVVGDAFRVAQPEGQDRLRPSSAWIWVFSSTHNTTALSGGFRYSPTMSRTLSTKAGSVESLKLFERCGCTPKSESIRATVLFERPVSEAAERTVQCCAFGRLLLQNGAQQAGDAILVVGTRPARTSFAVEAHKTLLGPLLPPVTDGRIADAEAMGDRDVGFAICRGEK
jgi:hypothetical protein